MPRRTLAACATLVVVIVAAWPVSALAQTPSPNSPTSSELVEQPGRYDGTWVTFTGEAIGEVMVRGDHAWLHLNDDAYYLENVEEGAELGGYNSGHAVWIPAGFASQVKTFGDYGHEGDVVRVTGVFNAACAEHGGDMDIHATTLEIVGAGRAVVDTVKPAKVWVAFGLTLVAAAFFGLTRLLEARRALGQDWPR